MARPRSKFPSNSSLSRRRGRRKEREKILVVTEGIRTETEYINGLAAHIRATGMVLRHPKVAGAGKDSFGIIKKAAELSENGKSIGRRGGYDAVWCVFDVDDQPIPRLRRAVSHARQYGFNVSISNPCFEIWLLWHFEDCGRYMTRKELTSRVRKVGVPEKSIPRNFPFENYIEAIARSAHCVEDVPANPGTGVWALAERLGSTSRMRR